MIGIIKQDAPLTLSEYAFCTIATLELIERLAKAENTNLKEDNNYDSRRRR